MSYVLLSRKIDDLSPRGHDQRAPAVPNNHGWFVGLGVFEVFDNNFDPFCHTLSYTVMQAIKKAPRSGAPSIINKFSLPEPMT